MAEDDLPVKLKSLPRDRRGRPGMGKLAAFFSTPGSFLLPPADQITPGEPTGYYVDMRVKASAPEWPEGWPHPPGRQPYVGLTQMALGCLERHLAGDGDEWLALAREAGDFLVESQEKEGPLRGAYVHRFSFPHTYALPPGWVSSMAQGQAASVLVRLAARTGDDVYAEAARLACLPMEVPASEGGTVGLMDGKPLPEEYPVEPPAFVLNGLLFSIWGWYDVGHGLGDRRSLELFDAATDTIAANIQRWDTGWWSLYDLYPHPVRNIASSAYHLLHINQLKGMQAIAPRPEFEQTLANFERYLGSRVNVARAFAAKAAFRIVVPRDPKLAKRFPWSKLRR
jgi:hypothetical protein